MPGPSSTTTRHQPGQPAPRHAPRPWAAPAPPPRLHGEASARSPAWLRPRLPAAAAACEADPFRPAAARDTTRPPACRERPAQPVCPAGRPRATLPPAHGPAQTALADLPVAPPPPPGAPHSGTHPRPMPWMRAALPPPRATEPAPRRARSGAQRARPGRARRSSLPPPAREYLPGARRARHRRARRAPSSCAGVARQAPQPPARGQPSRPVARAWGQARQASARPRRVGRSAADAGPGDAPHARRWPCRHARPASPLRRPAPSQASPGRAKRVRSRLLQPRTGPGRRLLWTRRRAPHFARASLPGRDRRVAPSRCPAAPAQARRRAGQCRSVHREHHLPPAPAPQS